MIPYLSDARALIGVAVFIFAIIAMPAALRWAKTVRCPICKKWFKLEYRSFDVREKVEGRSSARFGGGLAGRLRALIFGRAARTNADTFIREWGMARFTCQKCGCCIEIDAQRDRK